MIVELDDIYLHEANTEITSEEGSHDSIKYAHSSMQGWRQGMEDAIICQQLAHNESLFGVLDGHGGFEVAQVVSRKFPLFLQSNAHYKEKNYEKALQETFEKMDDWLTTVEGRNELVEERFGKPIKEGMLYQYLVMVSIKNQKKTMESEFGKLGPKKVIEMIGMAILEDSGCTANIVLVTDTQVYCANIGDSRAACIQNNAVTIMSFDHKPDNRLERARIVKAGGFVSDGRVCGALSLSRAFGDYQYKEENHKMVIAVPDVTVFDRSEISLILLACDGIWEQHEDYGEAVMHQINKMHKAKTPSLNILNKIMNDTLAQELTEETIWGLDNMSCILVTFDKKQSSVPIKKRAIKKNKK